MLVRHPETKQLYINYDPKIPEMLRETQVMQKMDLEVPHVALNLLRKQNALKKTKVRSTFAIALFIYLPMNASGTT